MNKELAIKLKNAGFPQECTHPSEVYPDGDGHFIRKPTLSELIAACSEELDEINIYITHDLVEVGGANPLYGHDIKVVGNTPEEAVANLYIALYTI